MTGCETKDMQGFADIFAKISQVYRLQIICLLNTTEELCVCDIIDALELKQNLVSHHLNILKDIGLLTSRREGKKIFYAIEKKVYQNITSNIKNIFSI